MALDQRDLRLRCLCCDAIAERLVDRSQLQVTVRGEFLPIACDGCGEKAMVPTVRPWELTFNDRKLLRQMRITVA